MTTYTLHLHDDGGVDHTVPLTADSDAQAIAVAKEIVQEEAEEWCSDGEWSEHVTTIEIDWSLTRQDEDDKLCTGDLTVDITGSRWRE